MRRLIINTGMRTDIPAFYSEWLMNRVRDGFVYVRNPYYRLQVSKYSLSPDVVDCLAFCTKNPHPMLKYLDELKEKYNMFWFVTITPYGKDLEPNVPLFEKGVPRTARGRLFGRCAGMLFVHQGHRQSKHDLRNGCGGV